jgi:F-type H+-transporting ATPase subunit delta
MAPASVKRYARAVFEIALEQNALDRWQSDLSAIATLASNKDAAVALEAPRLSLDIKRKFIEQQLPGLNPLAENLLHIMAQKRMLASIDALAAEYARLVDARRGILHADVITATPLDEGQKTEIKGKLAEITGQQINISTSVDPSIMGGFIAKVGNKLIDASTHSRLVRMKKNISGITG